MFEQTFYMIVKVQWSNFTTQTELFITREAIVGISQCNGFIQFLMLIFLINITIQSAVILIMLFESLTSVYWPVSKAYYILC